MLEGACGAVEDFARSLGAAGAESKAEPFAPGYEAGRLCTGDDGRWRVADVPATHRWVAVYRDRVLATFSGRCCTACLWRAGDAMARTTIGAKTGYTTWARPSQRAGTRAKWKS